MPLFRSTPPHGGRPSKSCHPCRNLGFDPRPRMGGDDRGEDPAQDPEVSIHAPAWGATSRPTLCVRAMRFRSTPPHGGRPQDPDDHVGRRSFDPRPRMGGDRSSLRMSRRTQSFDPRPRMGGRRMCGRNAASVSKFRSPPPHGGRPIIPANVPANTKFRSTPPHGGRPPDPDDHVGRRSFDPRPRMGGRRMCGRNAASVSKFRSTPPHGGRPATASGCCASWRCFDPRPRMGGDSAIR